MGFRHSELAAFGPEVVPLGPEDALALFRRASDFASQSRYGLNEALFPAVERLDVDEPGPDARQWLADRVDCGELLLVFGKGDVFRVPASLFLDQWQDRFCPSRDDVVILPVIGGWALFYHHEDEFEFARCGPQPPKQGKYLTDGA